MKLTLKEKDALLIEMGEISTRCMVNGVINPLHYVIEMSEFFDRIYDKGFKAGTKEVVNLKSN